MHTDQDFPGYAHDSVFYGAVPITPSVGAMGVLHACHDLRHSWLGRGQVAGGALKHADG